MLVNVNSGIRKPEDLKGKRFGLTEYTTSSAVWIRAVLQHDFHVAPQEISWYLERPEELSRDSIMGAHPPENITIRRLTPDQDLSTMLLNGEVDATSGPGLVNTLGGTPLDRAGRVSLEGRPEVRKLFDFREETARFFQARGYIPPNHLIATLRRTACVRTGASWSTARGTSTSKGC